MKLTFLPQARSEERQAARRYQEERNELALRFRRELRETVQRIQQAPKQFPRITQIHRKALLPVFPYAVIFEELDSEILIVAVPHLKRDPLYWQDRTN